MDDAPPLRRNARRARTGTVIVDPGAASGASARPGPRPARSAMGALRSRRRATLRTPPAARAPFGRGQMGGLAWFLLAVAGTVAVLATIDPDASPRL